MTETRSPRETRDNLLAKIAFYQSLEALENSDEEESDPGRQLSENVMNKALVRHATKVTQLSEKPRTLLRSLSDGYLGLIDGQDRAKTAALEEPKSEATRATPPSLLGRSATDLTDALPASKSRGKRKRDSAPQDGRNQLFRGLQFYFFPNNNVAPARRMRIAKATEFGAVWQRDWNSDIITHVILDKNMTYDLLVKFLKLENLPDHILVVHENYPANCIAYRTILDPTLPQFAVKGRQAAHKLVTTPSKPSDPLELKLRGGNARLRQPRATINGEVSDFAVTSSLLFEDAQPPASDHAPDETRTLNEQGPEDFIEALKQAKAMRHLVLEDEEDLHIIGAPDALESNDNSTRSQPPLTLKKIKPRFQMDQDKFQCMHKHTGETTDSPNLATINMLQQMADYYNTTKDEWRARAYQKAIATLRNHPRKISTKEEAMQLPHVGDRLASKIAEITFTHRLRRLESTQTADPRDRAVQAFTRIYGVGFAQASRWAAQGYATLADVRQRAADLTAAQRIGIAHYDDFTARIPRAEVAEHGRVVREALQRIDAGFEVVVGGSYRRGATTSGDIDCIVTRPGADARRLRDEVFGRAVPQMQRDGFVVAALTEPGRRHSSGSGSGGSKWHGASCLPGAKTWRRLDLLLVPEEEMGAALIYFTGNDVFNRSLRLLASKKGMRLNQRGLYRDAMRGKGDAAATAKVTGGTLIEGKDEKRIFEILGVPWRPPEHRVC